MSFKTVLVIDGEVCASLFFSEKVKRIDIRRKDKGYWTKNGVSLTASEFRFCLMFSNNFLIEGETSEYYSVTVKKDVGRSFKIMKKGKSVVTTCEFWKELEPMTRGLTYLITEEKLPKMTLLDLYIVTGSIQEEEFFDFTWKDKPLTTEKGDNSYLTSLGLLQPGEVPIRKIDSEALTKFAEEDLYRFESLLRLMYTYKREPKKF